MTRTGLSASVARPPGARPSRLEARLRVELAALERVRPRRARLLLRIWRHPAWVLMPVSLVVGVACGVLRQDGDQVRFRAAGLGMLGQHFFDVFADSWLQVGPVYLVVLGLVAWLGTALHLSAFATGLVASAGHSLLITALALAAARRAAHRSGAWMLRAQWVVASVVVLGGVLSDALVADHPEELLLGFMLALGATVADMGKLNRAAGLLVLAVGVKQWAITAAGLLLRGRRRVRQSLIAAAVLLLGVAILYLPFRIWGQVNTFEQTWKYAPNAWVTAVPGLAAHPGWTFRLLQGGAAGVAGILVAARARGSALVAVMASVAVRLLLDPLRLTYYWGAFVAVALVWFWTTDSPAVRRVRPWMTALVMLLPFCSLVPKGAWWHGETVVAIALPILALVVERAAPPVDDAVATPASAVASAGRQPDQTSVTGARSGVADALAPSLVADEPRRTTAIEL